MRVEFSDVVLCGANGVVAELVGMVAISGEMLRDVDGKELAVGKVDELCGDGSHRQAELNVVHVIEAHGAREAIAVVWVATVGGDEGV